jgi:hypothetical protein
MLILTDRELEFLASFNANWRRLYWNELTRLLREGGQPARHPLHHCAENDAKDPTPMSAWVSA